MSARLQQTPAPVAVGQDMSEAAIQLKALVDHQAIATAQLITDEARANSVRFRLQGMTGTERQEAEKALRSMDGDIRAQKADLDGTRQRIREIRGSMPVSSTPAPSATVAPPKRTFGYSQTEFEGIAGLMVLFPIVLAATRWAWRRGSTAPRPASFEGDARFTRLEQAVESIAIEVERIGESQRFAAKLLTERQSEPSRAQRRVVTPLP